ncbi:hypothetical protein GCM10007385_12180 [Tateyamaria omphalii]|uniref:DUF1499 domain-containing protein n=1 Tax=Tateyamaria omphalii TaxID=299262 RepID=UPI00167513AA|nr:DUF1499 domain-containing protein [Tateyamaria omphalii]GGX46218.1 hypothetical protein GCM10007385_12180 [Tateyamaria omphalii]
MKFVMYVFVLICVLLVGLLVFVRLAPTEPTRWHQPVAETNSQNMMGGAIRVEQADEAAFVRVDAAARMLPRTRVIAGSVDDGRVTYVTRSKWIGFPDYTTIEYSGGVLKLHARLRFGRSDFGVNRERLERLLVAAQEG